RGPSSVRLTDAGRVLVEHAEAILARLHEAETDVRAAANGGSELRLATFPSAAATLLPRALRAFAALGPTASVTMVETDPEQGVSGVRAGEFDVALTWEYDFVPAPMPAGVERSWLLDDPIHVLLPASEAAPETVDLATLAERAWITSTPRSSCHPFTRRACQAAGFEPRAVAETDDHRVLQRLVAEGVGVALESELSLREVRADVAVRPLTTPLQRRIFAASRRDAGPLVVAFVGVLRDVSAPRLRVLPNSVHAA
ncbi:MAG: LysR substrate-binding domain-containing protein, partial [Actinomycetota bacterium]|nr:LysR substrate-binding domain-containing protein [Actinomycetota bacterium]